jgi:carbonic anhydrase/SulP family sulfate permease
MTTKSVAYTPRVIAQDCASGLIVFLVALPLCLGIALASGAPPFAGLLAGIIGGIVVGILSGSHTSVSGPAAGLTAIVSMQIAKLESWEAILFALAVGGLLQIGMGFARAGALSAFFPTSVIKGLLAAIGLILILKQLPHVLGHDADPEGEMSFLQPDSENTFTELWRTVSDIHLGAAVIGLSSLLVLVLWDRVKWLKNSLVPGPLVVVLLGVAGYVLFESWGGVWAIQAKHMVQVPVADSLSEFVGFMRMPDFSVWLNPTAYVAAVTIAIVASLETLLNLEAMDKLDPQRRQSPPSRELIAQGVGNTISGLIGGLPMTSVIVRGSVNVTAGAKTKVSAIAHGFFLLGCALLMPTYLNMIPLSCLAAILLVTGIKLSSPKLIRQMWSEGRYQFLPFIATMLAIVFTDLLLGTVIGLCIASLFILWSNLRKPIRRTLEKHAGGDVLHVELANQVSFLNRAALEKVLREAEPGTHVLLDARTTDYIDPDVLGLIREFKENIAPMQGVEVSLRGFRERYKLEDEIRYVDYTTRELQAQLTPANVLQLLQEGNERFRANQMIDRDVSRLLSATAMGQHPMAVVLGCIDSRTPVELLFDVSLGDLFSVRIAGNVVGPKVLASVEYSCLVAGAKLIVVLGHTKCGAVTAAVRDTWEAEPISQTTGCEHLDFLVKRIQQSIDPQEVRRMSNASEDEKAEYVDEIARRNVHHSMQQFLNDSPALVGKIRSGQLGIVGGVYDVQTGHVNFFTDKAVGLKVATMVGTASD